MSDVYLGISEYSDPILFPNPRLARLVLKPSFFSVSLVLEKKLPDNL